MKVVYVDSNKFRKTSLSNEEFCTIAIHDDFPTSIPKNEIWIDSNIKLNEIDTLLKGVIKRISLGDSYSSYEKAQKYEKSIRNGSKSKIKKKKYISLDDGENKIKVYFVSGKSIRDKYKTDFSQGGHGYVYNWILKDEIWIEEEEIEECTFILAHEYVEMMMMRELGMKYEKAHGFASKIENWFRNRKFGEHDYQKMTDNIAVLLDMVK